jgi:REP-associated tyrosine transposase
LKKKILVSAPVGMWAARSAVQALWASASRSASRSARRRARLSRARHVHRRSSVRSHRLSFRCQTVLLRFSAKSKWTVQQKIKFPCGWGGKRRNAGRPARGPRPSEKHKTRPRLLASEPVHVTLRVAHDVARLRTRTMYKAIRSATIALANNDSFRIVHLSIQHGHVHLICEARDRMTLARGVQGFAVSAARHINRAATRRGTVFPDRYHAVILKSPTQVRNAIRYVLNNWRHHGHDRKRTWLVDPFSSGVRFAGWKELEGHLWMWKPPPTYEQLLTWLPKTWLLAYGWQRSGAISAHDVPRGDA